MKDEIYYIKQPGDGSEDDVYLVHIDPAVFEGTSWMYQQIELAVTGTPHVMVISPENYDGDITNKVIAFPSPASTFLPESLCREGFNEKSILTAYSKIPLEFLDSSGILLFSNLFVDFCGFS